MKTRRSVILKFHWWESLLFTEFMREAETLILAYGSGLNVPTVQANPQAPAEINTHINRCSAARPET